MIKLYPDEKIILEARRHWFVLLTKTLILFVLAVVPFILFPVLLLFGVLSSIQSVALYFFAAFAWLLLLWISFFVVWTNYYLDVWIITDRRVIDVEQYRLFSREVSECRLDRVQDITVEVHGLLATLMRFGDIFLQTAAEQREFVIKNIPKPDRVKEVIFKAQEQFLSHKRKYDDFQETPEPVKEKK